ncbi:MAG TPA: CBS domain-containing protein, partial [Dehalococcoidales bacterium]|nr:CBS domain-containing protein [Dehalococcoidales bacterium]
ERATRIASWVGWGIGSLLVIGGIVVMILYSQWFTGLFLAFVGWVLQSAATHSRNQVILYETLRSVVAQDIMTKEYSVVNPQLSLSRLVRDYVMVTGQRYFVVADEAKLLGIVTVRNIKSVPRRRWKSARVGKVMTPVGKLKTAYPQQSGSSLLELMDEIGVNQIPVLEEDGVIGVVIRDSLIRLVKTRAKLGV